ncbi:FAD-dependent oxidoreductase [Acidovorax sp. SUPP2539]|uniref:FAD-dependent oxidoreductase n=1 Tax=Acidovorax sp. SUPP2539 TaxID=2920878 RepID=UPI0023DE4F87|nr:FAD-dependent oxidoreductase [Acidovorax sp. SUPP2539]GKS92176.1 FAD-dependent oxidoreductase [Acidovorax sp. SUPP2539]
MDYDLVVIGAGPAGMTAATQAAGLGLKVLLLDEQAQAGGQIYRRVQEAGPQALRVLGDDYATGRALVDGLQASGAETCFGAFVVDVSQQLEVSFQVGGGIRQARARQLVVATGAMERASPFPGWTLPGVMPAGAAQIALKADAVIPSGRVAVAGCGPLFLLVSQQLLRAGADVVVMIETGEPGNARRALPHLPSALRSHRDLLKGLSMMRGLWRARAPWFRGCDALQAIGDERVHAIRFRHRGKLIELAIDTLLVHHGVVPNHQLSRLLGLAHRWSNEQLAWQIECDLYGQTSMPGVFVAGDGASIAGALAAADRGTLAALGAARALGRIGPEELHRAAAAHVAKLRRHTGIRPLLDTLYAPPEWLLEPADDTIVCRCERVSAGTVRDMADLGCAGPNQSKFLSRCGMGPCQGRTCGTSVTQLMAQRLGLSPDEVGAYRVRPPLKPLPLSVIANFNPCGQP